MASEKRTSEVDESEQNKCKDGNISKADLQMQLSSLRTAQHVADDVIGKGNKKLQEALLCKTISRTIIQQAQSQIEMGLERKKALSNKIAALEKKL